MIECNNMCVNLATQQRSIIWYESVFKMQEIFQRNRLDLETVSW